MLDVLITIQTLSSASARRRPSASRWSQTDTVRKRLRQPPETLIPLGTILDQKAFQGLAPPGGGQDHGLVHPVRRDIAHLLHGLLFGFAESRAALGTATAWRPAGWSLHAWSPASRNRIRGNFMKYS